MISNNEITVQLKLVFIIFLNDSHNIDFLYDLKEKNETNDIFFNKFLTDG